ncbi:MAG: DUF2341 domain-containing protein [Pirellulaceae bacterium]
MLSHDDAGRTFEIHLLDSNRDGVEQITEILAEYHDVDAVHVVSHGTGGAVQLGNTWLNQQSLQSYAGQLAGWGGALAPDGDLLFYGCDLAADEGGRELIDSLKTLCDCDVAASDDPTGAALLGGDWELEYQAGLIETEVAFSLETQQQWQGLLDSTSFQQGSGGYTGTSDTELAEALPTTNLGTAASFRADQDESGGETQGLIRFDNIFGTGPGQIPWGSIINSASLTVNVSEQGGGTVTLHRMLSAWSESSTWNSTGSGIQTNDIEASSAVDSTLADPTTTGAKTFSGLASTLQDWANGAANYGWVVLSDNFDGIEFDSSENGTAGARPQLNINYTPPSTTITARETVDSDADGQIDHIKITTDQNLDDDFSGLTIAVDGYTVTGYVTNIGVGGANDNVFYVQLTESGGPDTGATPDVTVTANTTLSGSAGSTNIVADWWDADWLNRKQITFDNSASDESLTDFPVLVSLTGSDVDFDKIKAGGADIRFVDDDGILLNYEIEAWDDGAETASIWVKVQQLDRASNTDFIHMYYNNTAASDAQSAAGVWSSGIGVWHLDDDPGPGGAGDIKDSDATPLNGTAASSMTSGDLVAGKIGDAIEFDGVDDYIDFAFTDVGNTFTIEAWIKPDSSGTSIQTIAGNTIGGANENGFRFFINESGVENGRISFETGNGASSNTANSATGVINFDQWNHVAVVVDRSSGQATIYHNGVDVTIDNTIRNDFDTSSDWEIGRLEGNLEFKGVIDEFRIANAARSTDTIEASYLSQNGVFAFTTFGSEETIGIAAVDKAGPVLLSATTPLSPGSNLFQTVGQQLDLVFSETLGGTISEVNLEAALQFAAGATDGDNLPTIGAGVDPISLVTTSQTNDTIRVTYNTNNVVNTDSLLVNTHTAQVAIGTNLTDAAGNVANTSGAAVTIIGTAPALDLDANNSSGATGADFSSSFTEDGGAVLIADADAALSDVDSTNLSSLTVTITNLLDGAAESLSANTAGTSITANYVSGTGVLTLSGADTVANYQQVLRTVSYNNTSQDPTTTARTITFQATDGALSSNLSIATVAVTDFNNAPVAVADSFLAEAGSSYTLTIASLLGNDSDAEGSPLSIQIVGGPSQGALVTNADGSFTYTPNPLFVGVETFSYRVSDGDKQSEVVTVTLNVQGSVVLPPTLGTSPSASDASDSQEDSSNEEPANVVAPTALTPNQVALLPVVQDVLDGRPDQNESGEGRPSLDSLSADLPTDQSADAHESADLRRGIDGHSNRLSGVGLAEIGADSQRLESLAMNTPIYWDQLDSFRGDVQSTENIQLVVVGTAAAATTALSVGYVFWTLKGGYLVASAMASTPLWRMIDPLPILNDLPDDLGLLQDSSESLESIVGETAAEVVEDAAV